MNNAGWHPPHRPIDDFSVEEFRAILELNVVSVFVACKAALPALRKTRGSIVNVASLVATIGQHHATTYVATKGAVLSFTKALAVDEAIHDVRVNSISPGNVFTPLWQEAIDAAPDPAACRADGEAAQPLGHMGTPRRWAGSRCSSPPRRPSRRAPTTSSPAGRGARLRAEIEAVEGFNRFKGFRGFKGVQGVSLWNLVSLVNLGEPREPREPW